MALPIADSKSWNNSFGQSGPVTFMAANFPIRIALMHVYWGTKRNLIVLGENHHE